MQNSICSYFCSWLKENYVSNKSFLLLHAFELRDKLLPLVQLKLSYNISIVFGRLLLAEDYRLRQCPRKACTKKLPTKLEPLSAVFIIFVGKSSSSNCSQRTVKTSQLDWYHN